jgi:hypothetical protein
MTLDNVMKDWANSHVGKVAPLLERRGRKWCVRFEETWQDDTGVHVTNNRMHTEMVDWAVEQLASWPMCVRMAYDQWFFDRKQDAEKFITLCNLKWQ